jgi:lysophospholipase
MLFFAGCANSNSMFILGYLCILIGTLTAQDLATDPLQFFLSSAQSSFRTHPDKKGIQNHYYTLADNQPRAVVFLPGMGEASLKYYDLFDQLQLKKTTFYGWDHIGQGFSTHLVPEAIQKVHIDNFETHISALDSFLNSIRHKHKEIIVIGHSMGGHLALRLSIEKPGLIDKLVLSAPLIEINQTWVPLGFVSWLFQFLPGTLYPPFYFLFTKKSADGSFVTQSEKRREMLKKLFEKYPAIKRQGATVGWIRAAQNSIQKLSAANPQKINIPVYILQAEHDYLVENSAQNRFCKKIKYCKIEVARNSKHEILFEIDEIRNLAIQKMSQFIDSEQKIKTATTDFKLKQSTVN